MSFGTLICNAQRVTYSDLTYVLNHDLGNIEDYLSKKGFDYDRKDTVSDERTAYSIIFKKHYQDYKDNISISKSTSLGFYPNVTFSTTRRSDYLAFKNSIKQLGYKIGKTETDDAGSLDIEYYKGNMKVLFSVSRMKDFDTNYYIIYISKRYIKD